MNKLLPIGLSALLLVGGATLGHAQGDPNAGQHSGKKIEAILQDHANRIGAGVRSGELTRDEAGRLRAREEAVRVNLDNYRAANHGYLTNGQESSLEGTLAEISGEIHHDKHNAATR